MTSSASEAVALNDPRTRVHAGNGFLFERGYTIVWSGWDPDVPSANATMGAGFPMIMEDGKPLAAPYPRGDAGRQAQTGRRRGGPAQLSGGLDRQDRGAPDCAGAPVGPIRELIPPDRWEFADARSIRLLPKGTKFTPIDDLRALVRGHRGEGGRHRFCGDPRPGVIPAPRRAPTTKARRTRCAGEGAGIRHALAFGGSQSGRYLRHFIELGMNKDAGGRRVFDGMLAHTAGAGKVFANHTFGEPDRTVTQHEDHDYPENWFPFSTAYTTDRLAGKTGALFRSDGFDPLLIETNTSTEYWQKGASLLTTDPSGTRDLTLPRNLARLSDRRHAARRPRRSRLGAGRLRQSDQSAQPDAGLARARGSAGAMGNEGDRAAAEPGAVDRGRHRGRICRRANAADQGNGARARRQPDRAAGRLDRCARNSDGGAHRCWARRITARASPPWTRDGNEVAGIRLPPIAVPLATYTGWNVYKAAPGELCDRDGSYMPFAKTRAEREASGDARPSVEERYGSRAAYVAKVKAAADALVAERLLLPADAAAYVKAAETSDRF